MDASNDFNSKVYIYIDSQQIFWEKILQKLNKRFQKNVLINNELKLIYIINNNWILISSWYIIFQIKSSVWLLYCKLKFSSSSFVSL